MNAFYRREIDLTKRRALLVLGKSERRLSVVMRELARRGLFARHRAVIEMIHDGTVIWTKRGRLRRGAA